MSLPPRRARSVLLVTLALGTPAVWAEPPGSEEGLAAVALCRAAERATVADQPALLDVVLARAEAAVAADERDAAAHFAVFCSLGRLEKLRGVSLRSLFTVRRLRREIDTALSLAPEDPDVLTAKGAFLLTLPRLLGGDRAEGERLLRHVLQVVPDHCAAKSYLAQAAGDGEVAALDPSC